MRCTCSLLPVLDGCAARTAGAGVVPAFSAIARSTARRYQRNSNADTGAVSTALAISTIGNMPVVINLASVATGLTRLAGACRPLRLRPALTNYQP